MRPNSLRQKLGANEITVCTRIFNPEPMSVEVLGQTGQYDYVEFVAEYGSFHLHDLDNVCRAAELYGLGSMIKIDQSHQAFLAQRGIGAGFQAVLFTDCRSADDVRECVRIARPDTPEHNGLYGAAARRTTPMGVGGSAAYVQGIRDTVVAVMIEKKGAVDELEEILSIPGLDMVQWGGTDYSMSTGRIGAKGHPDVCSPRRWSTASPRVPRSALPNRRTSTSTWGCATSPSAPTWASSGSTGRIPAVGCGRCSASPCDRRYANVLASRPGYRR